MEPRRTGRREGELTVDELAAETGMTVRNVRAYSSRGLLPPPRLEGRTGYYGPDHVARLTLVREMLDQGYTLTAAEKLISAAPGSGSQALGLYHALMSPWEGIESEVVEPLSLAREAGIAFDRKLIDRLIELGLGVETDDARLEIDNPTLVRAGLQVIAAGVPADRVLSIVPSLREHADAVSTLFVGLVFDSLWKEFVDAGMPARAWPRMQQSIEEIIPLAGQALLAAFQASLGDAITTAMRTGLEGVDAFDSVDQDGGSDPAEGAASASPPPSGDESTSTAAALGAPLEAASDASPDHVPAPRDAGPDHDAARHTAVPARDAVARDAAPRDAAPRDDAAPDQDGDPLDQEPQTVAPPVVDEGDIKRPSRLRVSRRRSSDRTTPRS